MVCPCTVFVYGELCFCICVHVYVCKRAHEAEATGDAGNDELALWENDAVKNVAAEAASLYGEN